MNTCSRRPVYPPGEARGFAPKSSSDMTGPPLRTSCGGGPAVLRKDLGAKPLASPTFTSLAAATGTYTL